MPGDGGTEYVVNVRLQVRDMDVLYYMARAVLKYERNQPDDVIEHLIGTVDDPRPKTCLAIVCLRHDIPGGGQIIAADIIDAPEEDSGSLAA